MGKRHRESWQNAVNRLVVEYLESEHSPLDREQVRAIKRAAKKTLRGEVEEQVLAGK